MACDHYNRWREDVELIAALGLQAYRFSVAWARAQPDGRGALDARGVGLYRQLAESLLDRGIEPVATLHHSDLPAPVQDRGGWGVAFHGHADGSKAPGPRDWSLAALVTHRLLVAHGLTVRALRARACGLRVPAAHAEAQRALVPRLHRERPS